MPPNTQAIAHERWVEVARDLVERVRVRRAESERLEHARGQPAVVLFPRTCGRSARQSMPTMPDELEIERKFLVDRLPHDLDAHPAREIDQGYLAITDDVEVRLRQYGQQTFLTIKSGGDRARIEEELEIDARRFDALWPLTDGRRLQKRRYAIPAADALTIELDVYHGQLSGLRVAEVEFDSAAAADAFAPPAWFGREVTDDPRYKNKRLATEGQPSAR
jgi:adenylate cyclase